MGGFGRKRHPIVPNKKPAFAMGDTVRVISPRHPDSGKVGEIVEVNPNQSQAIYMVKLGEWKQLFPEKMLRKEK